MTPKNLDVICRTYDTHGRLIAIDKGVVEFNEERRSYILVDPVKVHNGGMVSVEVPLEQLKQIK